MYGVASDAYGHGVHPLGARVRDFGRAKHGFGRAIAVSIVASPAQVVEILARALGARVAARQFGMHHRAAGTGTPEFAIPTWRPVPQSGNSIPELRNSQFTNRGYRHELRRRQADLCRLMPEWSESGHQAHRRDRKSWSACPYS